MFATSMHAVCVHQCIKHDTQSMHPSCTHTHTHTHTLHTHTQCAHTLQAHEGPARRARHTRYTRNDALDLVNSDSMLQDSVSDAMSQSSKFTNEVSSSECVCQCMFESVCQSVSLPVCLTVLLACARSLSLSRARSLSQQCV
jgi:hypothetical protein